MASGMHSAASLRPDHGKKSKQLNFEKAMSDFKNMFPSIDVDVIEMVLRANNGLVDATVDQLLTMQDETTNDIDNTLLDPNLNVRLPSYDDSGSLSTNDPPPAYTPRVENDPNFTYDSTFLGEAISNFSTPKPQQDTGVQPKASDWNPPLVGTLPNDFLRLSVNDQTRSHFTSWPTEPDEPHKVWVDSPVISRNPTTNRQTWTSPVSRTGTVSSQFQIPLN